jgi:hypothetical protein
MSYEARKDVMTVLPDGLNYDQRSLRRNLVKHFDAMTLTMNKTVLLDGIVGMASTDGVSIAANCRRHRLLHLRLRGPTRLVG